MEVEQHLASLQSEIAKAPIAREITVRATHKKSGAKIISTSPSDKNALIQAVAENPDVDAYIPPDTDESSKS